MGPEHDSGAGAARPRFGRPRFRRTWAAMAGAALAVAGPAAVGAVTGSVPSRVVLHAVPAGGGDAAGCPTVEPCTLAAALRQAAQPHTSSTLITLTAGTYSGTLYINSEVSITGAGDTGSGTLLEPGGTNAPVVVVGAAYTATLSDLEVTGGSAPLSGERYGAAGIDNAGTLTLDTVSVTGNQLGDAVDGAGGIVNIGTLTLDQDSVVSDNTATDSTTCAGGIANDGTLTIRGGSSVTGNSCTPPFVSAAGGVTNGGYTLATQDQTSDATVSITDATISDNSTSGCSSPCGAAAGGLLNAGTAAITDSTFEANSAGYGGGGMLGYGTATVTDSTFDQNRAYAHGGAIDLGDTTGTGGAGGSAVVTDSTFASNSAVTDGGAVDVADHGGRGFFEVAASTFEGNFLTSSGQGIDIDSSDHRGNGQTVVLGDLFADTPACGQVGGVWTDYGYNAGVDSSCLWNSPAPGDTVSSSVSTQLGTLQNNGGATETMMPEAGNPAIGLIPEGTNLDGLTLCPTTDQRGVPSAGACTAGAVQIPEVAFSGGLPPPPTSTTTSTTAVPVAPSPTPAPGSPLVTHGGRIGVTPTGTGWWVVGPGNTVANFGQAANFGSEAGQTLNAPVVAVAGTPDGGGYWLVAGDGGVFAKGDAPFFGSEAGVALNAPVVGLAPTSDGGGYWLVAGDGGVFSKGDAPFFGSAAGDHLSHAVVGLAPTPDGKGYWIVTSDGQVVPFGDASGAAPGNPSGPTIVGIISTSTGYVLIDSAGGTQ